ncbi:MAG: (d)CMP kinase [bacterium]
MKDLPVVTIDGPAGSGKSTTAKLVALRLGYVYLDTGAMYRAMALKAIRLGLDVNDAEGLGKMAGRTDLRVEADAGGTRVVLDGSDVTGLLRDPDVTRAASPVSAAKGVRTRMVEIQREIGRRGGIVAEGRDMGSVVFPDAEVKIYLEAAVSRRASRRQKDLLAAGVSTDVAKVEQDLSARDRRDSSREHSPLCVPTGAVVVDTTDLTIDQQVDRVLEVVRVKTGRGRGAASL